MTVLNEVKGWMTFAGWTNEGGPGAVKVIDGQHVAKHGDATWISNVNWCYDKVDRLALMLQEKGDGPRK